MFNSKCRILITNKFFVRDDFICLGSQLIYIVNSIKELLPRHVWYGADVDAVGRGWKKYNLNNIKLNVIGSDLQFIEYCSEIEQFIWGVFLCIDSNWLPENIELETEDSPFRSIPCNGVLIEIRAFDTSYFELYSDNKVLMKKISKIYNVEIENS